MKHFLLFLSFYAVFQVAAQKNYIVLNGFTLQKVENLTVSSSLPKATYYLATGEISIKGLKKGDRITISSPGFVEQTLTITDLKKQPEHIYLQPSDSLLNETKKNYAFYEALDTAGVMTKPDQMAQFPGGVRALRRFLAENINYPESTMEPRLSGIVYVRLLIGTDGTISAMSVVKGLTLEMDQEAVRVVRLMPKWEPATHAGVPVPCIFNLPVVLKLM